MIWTTIKLYFLNRKIRKQFGFWPLRVDYSSAIGNKSMAGRGGSGMGPR